MPRIALLCLGLAGACSFDADYTSGTYSCSDDKCPSGLVCQANLCVAERRDAAVDVVDTMPSNDADGGGGPEMSCNDPGILTNGQTVSGSTDNQINRMMSFCAGGVQNAKDAVYKITTTAPNQQLTVFITGSLTAYVLNSCMPNAACLTSNVASAGNSLAVTAANAGAYWVVVDNINVSLMGAYTLKVNVN